MPNGLRVVDVTEFYSARGGVRAHLDLKGQLSCQLGHHHLVLAPGPSEPGMAVAKHEGDDSAPKGSGSRRVIRLGGPALPYDRNYHLLIRLDHLRRTLKREDPDVIETNSPYVAAWAVHNLPRDFVGLKTFWWHSDFIDTWLELPNAPRVVSLAASSVRDVLWRWVRTFTSDCAAVFTASAGQAEKLRGHGVRKVVHLPFGVDKQIFRPEARSENERATRVAGRVRATTVVIGVGRLSAEKRWDVAIDAFMKFRRQREGVMLIYGDGPERSRLETRAARCADVHFMGFERDKTKLAMAMASADVMFHACPHETFGLGVAQAIACGTPVIVPDRGGAAELVSGVHGDRYRSLDVDDGARCLRCSRSATRVGTRTIDALQTSNIPTNPMVPNCVKPRNRVTVSEP